MSMNSEDLGRFFQTYHTRFGKCLEPHMACGEEAIRAHSIQNSGVIDLLATDNHVRVIRPKFSSAGPELDFELIGRNKAATFTGLCNKHDTQLFLPLDTRALDTTNREQLFLLAYRSVTRELHAVMEGASKIQSTYQSRVERGIDPKDEISPAGAVATQHLLIAFFTYQYRAEHFDKPLLEARFDEIEHDIIMLNNQPPVLAVSSLFSLDEVEVGDDVARVVLNVMPMSQQKTAVIFSYTRADHKPARAYFDRVFTAQGEYQKFELSRLILGRMENFLISPRHFDTWSSEKIEHIKKAFAGTMFNRDEVPEHPDMMLF